MTALADGLIRAMNDPSVDKYTDEFVTILTDINPKSRYHFLVLPKEDIPDLKSLRPHHVPKLVFMEMKGREYASRKSNIPVHRFQTGFHSYQSMERLHLHVLSDDFQGSHLNYSIQWNAFHTEFFVSTLKVILDLSSKGSVSLPPNKKLLYQKDMRCHKCDFITMDINNLKLHLRLFHV